MCVTNVPIYGTLIWAMLTVYEYVGFALYHKGINATIAYQSVI